jgi:hypothetical protein
MLFYVRFWDSCDSVLLRSCAIDIAFASYAAYALCALQVLLLSVKFNQAILLAESREGCSENDKSAWIWDRLMAQWGAKSENWFNLFNLLESRQGQKRKLCNLLESGTVRRPVPGLYNCSTIGYNRNEPGCFAQDRYHPCLPVFTKNEKPFCWIDYAALVTGPS